MAAESSWAILQPQLPPVIVDLTQALDTLVEAMLAILEVVRSVLDVIKAFLIGLLDPVQAIIDAIVAEIEGLLFDVRELGVYFAGDMDIEPPFENLLGGYTAYERRMIGRLVDRTDPTRPNFTSQTGTAAVFLYGSFDTSTIHAVMAFISQIRKFFGLKGKTRTYTIPSGLNVSYGSSETGLGAFGLIGDVYKTGKAPSVASVRWQMSQPPSASGIAWPVPAPPGFLVEVSVIPDGLTLAYQTPASQAQVDSATGEQNMIVGLVNDPEGQPFKLYGGLDMLDVDDLWWSQDGSTYTPPSGNGKTQIFAYRSAADNTPIPPNGFWVDGKPVLQRTFFVDLTKLGINVSSPGQQFSTILRYVDMPYDATFKANGDGTVDVTLSDEPAREVYVRISAVTKDVTVGTNDFASTFYWTIDQSMIEAGASGQVMLGVAPGIPLSAKSDPSSPIKVSFPSTQTSQYLDALTTALVVMVLSRADLVAQGAGASFQVDTANEPTGLEDVAQYLMPKVFGNSTAKFLKKNYPDVTSFRGALLQRCRALANSLVAKTGPLPTSVQDVLLKKAQVTTANGAVKPLNQVTWADLAPDLGVSATILESLDPGLTIGSNPNQGIAPNPVSVGNFTAVVLESRIGTPGLELVRTPGFFVPSDYTADTTGATARMNTGSADYSPVLYALSGSSVKMQFCRNVMLSNRTMLTAAATLLNVSASTSTTPSGSGAWQSYRLFPQGLPPVDAALGEITGFLSSIQFGLGGIADIVVAYINFLEARILELEALLRRIQGLLDLSINIQVPAAAGLVVTASGTDGILQALVTADNKPSDSAQTTTRIDQNGTAFVGGNYGAGVVLVTGGLPTSVLELLLMLFPQKD